MTACRDTHLHAGQALLGVMRRQLPARPSFIRINQAYENTANALPQRMQLLDHAWFDTALATEKPFVS